MAVPIAKTGMFVPQRDWRLEGIGAVLDSGTMKAAAAPKATDGLTAAAHCIGPCQAKEGVEKRWAIGSGKSRVQQVYKPISGPSSRRRLLATRCWKFVAGLVDGFRLVLGSWGVSEGVSFSTGTGAVASDGGDSRSGDAETPESIVVLETGVV